MPKRLNTDYDTLGRVTDFHVNRNAAGGWVVQVMRIDPPPSSDPSARQMYCSTAETYAVDNVAELEGLLCDLASARWA